MSDTITPSARATVYYDGGCPLCSREVAWYRGKTAARDIDWVDVAALPPEADAAPDLSVCDAMARFHVRTPDGALHVGARAFLALWRQIGGAMGLIARFLSIPPGPFLLERAYTAYLQLRPRLVARPPAG